MTWEIEEDEVRRFLAFPAGDRAVSFFQLTADWEEAWGLQDPQGWVVAKDTDALPLWPHSAFAAACARGPWEGTQPAALPVDELLEGLLPALAEHGLRVAVFPTPDDPGALLSPGEFRDRLRRELELGEG